jgi:NosR/NirI family transcriptional regulator, nitrous oxide reductase regulator
MKKKLSLILLITVFAFMVINAFAIQRFPKPEFENGYSQPAMQLPTARSIFFEYLDVVVLLASLSVITWLILKKRSRKGVLVMTIFSIVYFGFYRKGCICAVGSLQNITLALFNPQYSLPISAILFFIIPLLFSLFYGRTFCAGICPLGAIQDIVAIRPVSLKSWVQSLLGLIPFIYLGLAILYAATGTDFIICRYDPFIGIYRFNGSFLMFAIGGILLLVGVFIARPYCRFLCPYGVLLNLTSRVSKKHLTIAPTKCISCRLCEESCPFGAIQKPTPLKTKESRSVIVRRVILFSILTPALIVLGGWAGSRFHGNLAQVNAKVRLANELIVASKTDNAHPSEELSAFKGSGKPLENLYAEAASITRQFYYGGWILGGFLGLVFGLTLANHSIFRYRDDYTPNKGTCFSCARCVEYCPVKP